MVNYGEGKEPDEKITDNIFENLKLINPLRIKMLINNAYTGRNIFNSLKKLPRKLLQLIPRQHKMPSQRLRSLLRARGRSLNHGAYNIVRIGLWDKYQK